MGRRRSNQRQQEDSRTAEPAATNRARPVLIGLVPLLVCVVVAATHWPVLSAQAVLLDDYQFMIDNPLVRNPSWDSAGRFVSEVRKPSTVSGYYKPLTMISLMADCALGGRPDDLHQFHRTHLVVHVANAALVVLLLYLLFRNVWAAAAIGLLFGVHPLTVEPLAWVAERKTMLASLFALAAMIFYVHYVRRPAWWRMTCCTLLFVLALLCKPTATPLPVLLLLLDYWPLRRLSWRAVLEKTPLFVVAVVSAGVTIISQSRAAGLASPAGHDPLQILLVVCHNIVFYLHTLIWPVGLTWHYPFPEPLALSQPVVLAGVLGTIVLLAALLVSWRWTRAALVGWGFFFVAIFPTLGVIGFTYVIAAHKFVYLPVVGLLLPLTALVAWLWSASAVRWRRLARVVTICLILLAAALAARQTRRDLRAWRDSETLYNHMLVATPHADAIRCSLAQMLDDTGRGDEAIEQFETILRRRPEHHLAQAGLGLALFRQRRTAEAVQPLQEAVRLSPATFPARYNLAQALVELGRHAEAIPHFVAARRLGPNRHELHIRLGSAYLSLRRHAEALECYETALRLRPDDPRGHRYHAAALRALGRADEAVAACRQALVLDPSDGAAREQLDALLEWRQQRGNDN